MDSAIERILGEDSELPELWDEGGHNERWHRTIDDLRERIQGSQSGQPERPITRTSYASIVGDGPVTAHVLRRSTCDMLQVHQQPGRRTWGQVFLGHPEDPALLRAQRVAGSVLLLLLLAATLVRLLVLVGVLPEGLPFSWSGLGEELLVKPTGAFVVVLFLHLLRRLIRTGRRRLALALVAATGPLCFCLGLMRFGATQVFNTDVLVSDAIIDWLVLLLVPVIFCGVVLQLEPAWLRSHAHNAEPGTAADGGA